MTNIDNTINLHLKNIREQITDYIYLMIARYGMIEKEDRYIPSEDLHEESIYLKGKSEPAWNDDIDEEIVVLEELGSLYIVGDDIWVSTDKGVYDTEELNISDLLILYNLIKSRYEAEE